MTRHPLGFFGCLILVWIASQGAFAQSETDRLREALRVLTAQSRSLEDQRATLQAHLTQAEHERSQLKGEVEDARSQAAQADKDYRQAVTDFNERLEDRNKTIEKWKDAYAEAATVAQTKDAERAKFEASSNSFKQMTNSCQAKNERLVKINEELAAAYRDIGVIKNVTATEPLIGYGNVELKNKAQDFLDRILDQKAQP